MEDYLGDEHYEIEDFETPPITVLGRKVDARGMLITTMIMDGEICELEIPVHLHDRMAMTADPVMRLSKELFDTLSDVDDIE